MAELTTREQALAYLATIFPDSPHEMYPFEMGWVCIPILTQEELASSKAVGLGRLVIDSQTGVVMGYPSWSTQMVAEDYTQAKRSGRRPKGRQIYPYQWRITMRRLREEPETIEYQMTAISLTNPPEPTEEHPLRINKTTFLYEPTDSLSGMAAAKAAWSSRDNQGIWPEEATTEF